MNTDALAALEGLEPGRRAAEALRVAAWAADVMAKVADLRGTAVLAMREEGLTFAEIGAALGVSKQRAQQLARAAETRHEARWADATERTRRPVSLREQLRDDMRVAVRAQEQRAESYGMGYAEETAAFYGSPRYAQAETVETRLRVSDVDREYAQDRARSA